MRFRTLCGCVFLILSFTHPTFAKNVEVNTWVSQVLMATLSINYQQPPSYLQSLRPYYTVNSWDGLRSFLGNYVQTVQDNELMLHPIITTPAQVTREGDFSGIQYWQVTETIHIPELSFSVQFSVIVLGTSNPSQPYVIQSINMIKNDL